jgi:lipopolysaccharide transport system permease protein
MNTSSNGSNETVLEKKKKFSLADFYSVWKYRELIWLFFKRDFAIFYKQTILGPLWYFIQPIFTAITYYIVFSKIADLPTDGIPPMLFYFSGIILWGYFSTSLTNNSEIFSKNAQLFSKIYFPRLVVPLSVVMSGMVAFSLQFFILLVLIITTHHLVFSIQNLLSIFILIPALIVYVAALSLGVGLIISALTIRYRDLAYVSGFGAQLWMYATPVVYPYSKVPDSYKWAYALNPLTAPIETFRKILFDVGGVENYIWYSNCLITFIILIIGLKVFTKVELYAMDTV